MLLHSQSSVVITGVPTKDYRLPIEWVQPYTTVVNVSSFKNVDESQLLQIPGAVYVPLVGKVTVAMLERNLMRLFDQFHHPNREYTIATTNNRREPRQGGLVPWYGHPVQFYTAAAVTLLLVLEVLRKK